MGERTSLNFHTDMRESAVPRAISSAHIRADLPLVVSVIALTAFGLLMIYSASMGLSFMKYNYTTYYFERHIRWVLVSIVAAIVISRINYHVYGKLLLPMMGATIGLLLAALAIGNDDFGSSRSLLGGSVRPSEMAKLAIIIYLAFWMYNKREVLNTFSFGLAPMMLFLGVTGGLVLVQVDISAAVTIFILGAVMFFLAGGEFRQMVPIIIASAFLGWLVVIVYRPGYVRVVDYINGLLNPLNASSHVKLSMGAVINGGLFGSGIGLGSTKFIIPVAFTDSIFAVITEEVGLVGSILVLGAFLIILWRGLRIARRAPDMPGRLLAAGLTIWIVLEAMINMSVMVNVLPVAGNALPFISYSGSSLLMMYAAIGILTNIARSSHPEELAAGRPYRAVVDLRGRNSGRSVSRTGRSASTRK